MVKYDALIGADIWELDGRRDGRAILHGMEPASKMEMPKPPDKPESKPASASPTPPKESASETPKTTAEPGTPRATLEAIAAGKPVAEATKPVENLPDREAVGAILNEANTLLLDLRDMRLLVNSLATQAADTPLGNEVRLDALRSLITMETEGLPPESANRVTDLKEKIKTLNLPEAKPAESATVDLLNRYNEQFPDKTVPSDVMEAIKSGKRDASSTVSQMLQSNPDLAAMTWKDLTGMEGFTKLTPSPETMLDLAGLPRTPENMTKAMEIFGVAQNMKEPAQFGEKLFMGVMYGALGLMFFTQLATGEQQGGGGH